MILDCPSCSAKFKVDPALLGDTGRSVRCGNCGHSWHQSPPAPESEASIEAPLVAAAEPAAPARPARTDSLDKLDEQRGRRQRRAAVTSKERPPSRVASWALLALVALAVAVAGGLVAARDTVVAWYPDAETYYAALGLGIQVGAVLELRDVTSVRRTLDGERRLIVKGVIVNTSDRALAVPKLQASLIDSNGAQLGSWIFAADSSELPPGGVTTFETTAADPPGEGNLNLVFVD